MMRGLLTKKPKVEVVIDDPRERRVKLDITDPVRRSWKPVDVSKWSLDECRSCVTCTAGRHGSRTSRTRCRASVP
jgi:hypothetical protein